MFAWRARSPSRTRRRCPDMGSPRQLRSPIFSQRDPGRIRPTRVLILIHSLDIGGAETDLVRVLPFLDRDRFGVTVCTVQKRGTLADSLCEAGIEVIGPLSEKRCASRLLDMALRGMSGLGRFVALAFPASSFSRLLQVGSRDLRLS